MGAPGGGGTLSEGETLLGFDVISFGLPPKSPASCPLRVSNVLRLEFQPPVVILRNT